MVEPRMTRLAALFYSFHLSSQWQFRYLRCCFVRAFLGFLKHHQAMSLNIRKARLPQSQIAALLLMIRRIQQLQTCTRHVYPVHVRSPHHLHAHTDKHKLYTCLLHVPLLAINLPISPFPPRSKAPQAHGTSPHIQSHCLLLTTLSATDKSHIKSTAAASKDAGYASFPAFLITYGLKMSDEDAVKEGRAILRAMGYGV